MRKTYQIPEHASIHIIEHFAGNYFGSASFLLDFAARLSCPERIVIFSHKDISAVEFAEQLKQKFSTLQKLPEKIGRIICVDGDGIEDAANNQEFGLLPGMEMVLLVDSAALSGALKYIYNTSVEQSKWVSIVCAIQCGFGKTFRDILRRECAIGSCLYGDFFDTYIYEENRLPHKLNGENSASFETLVRFCQKNPIIAGILDNRPIPKIQFFQNNAVVDTLST